MLCLFGCDQGDPDRTDMQVGEGVSHEVTLRHSTLAPASALKVGTAIFASTIGQPHLPKTSGLT